MHSDPLVVVWECRAPQLQKKNSYICVNISYNNTIVVFLQSAEAFLTL